MKNIEGGKVHIKSWCPDMDVTTETQVRNLSDLPFAFHHICLMPDAHSGYGMPIGGVLATEGTVVPQAVGVDAGCGMLAFDLGEHVEDFMTSRDAILHEVMRSVPTGMNRNKSKQCIDLLSDCTDVINSERETAEYSLGTLGGGNHFIEFDKDELEHLWLVIHSGSRHLGQTLNKHYDTLAKKLNAKYSSMVPPSADLAFLPFDTQEATDYLRDMKWCVEYASENRHCMAFSIINALTFGFSVEQQIETRHNYATMENHFGKNVLVHRKGAVHAAQGELVVIPGSMGSKSYIATGLGNKDSFLSCSHGAGRPMSRTAAKKLITKEEYESEMEADDIMLLTNSDNVADESRGAYKSIDEVMANQSDLVTPLHTLTPLAVCKG